MILTKFIIELCCQINLSITLPTAVKVKEMNMKPILNRLG